MEEIFKNKYYDKYSPLITICTPVYNRRHTIERTLLSVKNQSFSNFEYIIVDDGSTECVDDIVFKFMEEVTFPIMFIKKNNGGVHTARNLAVKYARGKYYTSIDSDDELLPNALCDFIEGFSKIPKDKFDEYREVVALCVDQNGNLCGTEFSSNINDVDSNIARKMCSECHGEHISMDITKIRKENLFPEPEGVKFITECILWNKLDTKYKSYYINKKVRVYHNEGNDHITTKRAKNKQDIINDLYRTKVFLNEEKLYINSFKEKIRTLVQYLIDVNIVKRNRMIVKFDYELKDYGNILLKMLLYLPCLLLTKLYVKKRCSF